MHNKLSGVVIANDRKYIMSQMAKTGLLPISPTGSLQRLN